MEQWNWEDNATARWLDAPSLVMQNGAAVVEEQILTMSSSRKKTETIHVSNYQLMLHSRPIGLVLLF